MTQKLKFKVDGMKCDNCALLIEEKVKNMPGIFKVKISHDSGVGVAVYDDSKMKSQDIFDTIEKIGEFGLEEIIERAEENRKEVVGVNEVGRVLTAEFSHVECPFCAKTYSVKLQGRIIAN